MTDAASMSDDTAAVSGYVDELAAGWLAELRRDPVRAIEGLQLTVAAHQGGGSPRWLADVAMSMSENHDRATAEDPGAEQWCGFCGNSEPRDLVPGPDEPYFGERAEEFCADAGACAENRERRYPPDMARVPSWVLGTHRSLTEEEAAGALVRAACGQAAREYYLELTAAAREDELALAAPPEFPGWQATPSGAWDTRGGWHPAQPAYNINWSHINWQHTLRNRAHHAHLISGSQLTPARLAAMAAVSQARGAQVAHGSAQPAPGGQGGQPGIPPEGLPEGLPEGVRQAIQGDHAGGDIAMAPQVPEPREGPPRPSCGQRSSRRRLRYSAGRRQVVRKHPQAPPGDSGWGSSGEGPSGGSSET